MVKLADTRALGARLARGRGSSPLGSTKEKSIASKSGVFFFCLPKEGFEPRVGSGGSSPSRVGKQRSVRNRGFWAVTSNQNSFSGAK